MTFCLNDASRAVSSVVERFVDIEEVRSPILLPRTLRQAQGFGPEIKIFRIGKNGELIEPSLHRAQDLDRAEMRLLFLSERLSGIFSCLGF